MEKRIIFKRPGKEPEIMEVSAKYKCELKHLIANASIVEHTQLAIPAEDGSFPFQLLVDDDGHPKGLPFNFYTNTPNHFYPVQMIVGDAIITKFKPGTLFEDDYDYQIEGLTDNDIEAAMRCFADDVQNELGRKFRKLYPTKRDYLSPTIIPFN